VRVNVYAEEITGETELVTKKVTDDTFGTRTFYGVRFFLASPDVLHDEPDDDDRSAITLWVPWTREGGHDFERVATVLNSLLVELSSAWMHSEQLNPGGRKS
jgi:hypothetical protein